MNESVANKFRNKQPMSTKTATEKGTHSTFTVSCWLEILLLNEHLIDTPR